MITLFLIGNGYDVNCGMKTKYTDVYEGYIDQKSATENIKVFKQSIAADISSWGDFEMAMAEYAGSCVCESDFLECVRDFSEYMEKHLINEVKRFKDRITDKQIMGQVVSETRRSLSSFYNGISHNVDTLMEQRNASYLSNVACISFNYTDAFDYILEVLLEGYGIPKKKVIHIHGVLGDGPVFGVDNVEQIKASFSLSNKGKRGFVKPIFNDSYDAARVRAAKVLIDNANTICVFGMSLGESDLSWRNLLIQWLEKNDKNHVFVYNYDLSMVNCGTVHERMDVEEDEKYKLFERWGIDVENPVFEQVHIPCGKNIFNIDGVVNDVEARIKLDKANELLKRLQKDKEFFEHSEQEVAATSLED